ncbi:SubName: Full=Uncharacterized protein {ECO:0000313/EMBL:CCA73364.1} [Serendipita indica DSM 11827]|nr:SubName: Full=Uncharacterized protein {ECO:0000313/EMBL:CCA73364.1} [Serendipita indica DSM 11827]
MSPPTFYVPDLAFPTQAATRDAQRSPASSFSSKAPPPVELGRLSISSTTEHSRRHIFAITTRKQPYQGMKMAKKFIPWLAICSSTVLTSLLITSDAVFPPFWLLGALILVIPLTPPESWADKSQEQVQSILAAMRVAERRWAWRCVMALASLILVILIIVGSLLLAHHFGRL